MATKIEKLQNFCDKLSITDSGTGNHPHYHVYFTYNDKSYYAEVLYNTDFDCEFNVWPAIDDRIVGNIINSTIHDIDVCEQSLKTCIYDFLSNNINNKSGAKPRK